MKTIKYLIWCFVVLSMVTCTNDAENKDVSAEIVIIDNKDAIAFFNLETGMAANNNIFNDDIIPIWNYSKQGGNANVAKLVVPIETKDEIYSYNTKTKQTNPIEKNILFLKNKINKNMCMYLLTSIYIDNSKITIYTNIEGLMLKVSEEQNGALIQTLYLGESNYKKQVNALLKDIILYKYNKPYRNSVMELQKDSVCSHIFIDGRCIKCTAKQYGIGICEHNFDNGFCTKCGQVYWTGYGGSGKNPTACNWCNKETCSGECRLPSGLEYPKGYFCDRCGRPFDPGNYGDTSHPDRCTCK